jgi:hypothetical protein
MVSEYYNQLRTLCGLRLKGARSLTGQTISIGIHTQLHGAATPLLHTPLLRKMRSAQALYFKAK